MEIYVKFTLRSSFGTTRVLLVQSAPMSKNCKSTRQRALCILGMHRSGTSAVTRAFNLLGVFVGEESDMMPGTADNPLGFWERNDICVFHERLLAAVHRRWDSGLMLPEGWHRSPDVAPYREELKKIVGTVFVGHPLWAWKDPRTCVLLELWKDVLAESGIDLVAAVVVRHPTDIAASLARRDGFGREKSFGIWLHYLLAALRSIEGVPTTFISYDGFLEDPVGQLRRSAAAIGMVPADVTDETPAAIRHFVRKDLRHSQTRAHALAAVPSPVREVYELIRQVEENPASCDDTFFARIRVFHGRYAAFAGLFREDLEQYAMRATAAERSALIAEEQARVVDRERMAAARAFEEIAASRTWKATGPARKALDILLGKTRSGFKAAR